MRPHGCEFGDSGHVIDLSSAQVPGVTVTACG